MMRVLCIAMWIVAALYAYMLATVYLCGKPYCPKQPTIHYSESMA